MQKTFADIDGHFNYERLYDAAVNRISDGAVFVEIGCWLGRSTVYLASRIKAANKRVLFCAVDFGQGLLDNRSTVQAGGGAVSTTAGILAANIRECGLQNDIIQIVADSVAAAQLFQDASVDFCFIDGSHDFTSVTGDIRAWWPKIKPGGQMSGHDYTQYWPGVQRAVHEFFQVPACGAPESDCCWTMFKGDDGTPRPPANSRSTSQA